MNTKMAVVSISSSSSSSTMHSGIPPLHVADPSESLPISFHCSKFDEEYYNSTSSSTTPPPSLVSFSRSQQSSISCSSSLSLLSHASSKSPSSFVICVNNLSSLGTSSYTNTGRSSRMDSHHHQSAGPNAKDGWGYFADTRR